MSESDLLKELEKAHAEIADLRNRITQLERSQNYASLPDTMILDHNFVKRALAIYGHVLIAGFIIMIPIYCTLFLLSFLAGGF